MKTNLEIRFLVFTLILIYGCGNHLENANHDLEEKKMEWTKSYRTIEDKNVINVYRQKEYREAIQNLRSKHLNQQELLEGFQFMLEELKDISKTRSEEYTEYISKFASNVSLELGEDTRRRLEERLNKAISLIREGKKLDSRGDIEDMYLHWKSLTEIQQGLWMDGVRVDFPISTTLFRYLYENYPEFKGIITGDRIVKDEDVDYLYGEYLYNIVNKETADRILNQINSDKNLKSYNYEDLAYMKEMLTGVIEGELLMIEFDWD